MSWLPNRIGPPCVSTFWRVDEIIVNQAGACLDRLRASEIERVTLVHAGEGESPGDVRAVVFELADRAVMLDAGSGIAGRVLFELSFPNEETAREAMRRAIHKLPCKCRIVTREEQF